MLPISEHGDEDRFAAREGSQGLDDPLNILQLPAHCDPLYHQNDVPAQQNLEFADSRGNDARAQAQAFGQGPGCDSLNENTAPRRRHIEQRGECSRDVFTLQARPLWISSVGGVCHGSRSRCASEEVAHVERHDGHSHAIALLEGDSLAR